MKNIYLIPTDVPSRLISSGKEFNLLQKSTIDKRCKNVYITSDEEIKEGDWTTDGNYVVLKTKTNGGLFEGHNPKKVILTTDPDLIKDGVQPIDDTFLEWFVQNPSCEEVEVAKGKMKLNDDGQEYGFPDMSLYKIIIPQEESKQETLEEAAEKYAKTAEGIDIPYQNGLYYGFVEGAKWQAERMYSEDNMIAIVEKSRKTGLSAEYLLLTEQFKKK